MRPRGERICINVIKCLIDYVHTLQLHQIYCNIWQQLRKHDLFHKMGFVRIGIKKDWIKTADGYLDEYSIS